MGRLESIDRSLSNIWHSWYTFRRGKKRSFELDAFSCNLETNLLSLHQDLVNNTYKHGPYRTFIITDTKKRTISVAQTRDKIIHRLLYDYLVGQFDKTFIYDAWSCRKEKGLIRAIKRAQRSLMMYRYNYVWRGDIAKFFDSVDQKILRKQIKRRIKDKNALRIINEVIESYSSYITGKGMPIGNLSSQIFTNIYLHELDRYIMHVIKPFAYVRYGDDFIIISDDFEHLQLCRENLVVFIDQALKISIHATNDIIVPVQHGIHFLGCDIFPNGRRLRKRVYDRIKQRLNYQNSSSYRAVVLTHTKKKMIKWVDWNIMNMLENQL
jgi:RNA-directed DNA polymerase